ncbi:hypothetical protein [Spirosoma litoris]
MFKNLVRRSKFQRILVSNNAPVTLPLQADEILISLHAGGPTPNLQQVAVVRQTERDARDVLPYGEYDASTYLNAKISGLGERVSLAARPTSTANATLASNSPAGVDLMCGFADTVTFKTVGNDVGSVVVLIECINLVPVK